MKAFTVAGAIIGLDVHLTRTVYAEDAAGAKAQFYVDIVGSNWGPQDGGKDKFMMIGGPDVLDQDDIDTIEVTEQ